MKVTNVAGDVPPPVLPCPGRAEVTVQVKNWIPETAELLHAEVRNIVVRLTVEPGPEFATGTTDEHGMVVFAVERSAEDETVTRASIEADGIAERVESSIVFNDKRTYTLYLQRIGFEVESTKVKLVLKSKPGNTYGQPMIQTVGEVTCGARTIPVITMVLEERKATEDPKIEAVTAPRPKPQLAGIKKLIGGAIQCAQGCNTYQWAMQATAKATVSEGWAYSPQLGLFDHSDPPKLLSTVELENYKFAFNAGGVDLAQLNVDLYLDQLYNAPELMKSMIVDDDRARMYMSARDLAKDILKSQPILTVDPREHVAGLLTYSLYFAGCWGRFSVKKRFSKDLVQPLLKAPLRDLAQSGLDAAEAKAFASTIDALLTSPHERLKEFSKAMTLSRVVQEKNVELLNEILSDWFVKPAPHYPDSPTGKPIPPRTVGGRTMVVVESRKSTAQFNRQYYDDLP